MQMISPQPDLQPDTDTKFELQGFNVVEILDQRAIAMRKRRKRVRSRAALIAAAARELERVGYDALTVEGISEAAGMARGTFYLYYKNRSEIISVVMRFYWFLLTKHRPRGGSGLSLNGTIHRANSYTVHAVARNSRLLLGREALMAENHAIARRLEALNDRWADWVVNALTARGIIDGKGEDFEFHHLRARAVIGMSDVLLHDIYRSAELEDAPKPIDLDLVVRVLDDLWGRCLGS